MRSQALTQSAGSVDVHAAYGQVWNDDAFLLDVRGFDEFAANHALGAVCIPLPDLERRAGELPNDRVIFVMCQSGGRSILGAERLRKLGMDNIADLTGGLDAWRRAELPTVRQTSAIPLERQVRITAGMLIFSFSLAGFLVNRTYFYGATLIGFMLALTGVLDICPMMSVLRWMPWNHIYSDIEVSAHNKKGQSE